MIKKNIGIILICFFVFSSCKKVKVKKYSGVYDCQVNYHYYEIGSGPGPNNGAISIDSSYTEKVEIIRNGKSIQIFNWIIPVDSLKKGNLYRLGGGSNYSEIKIQNDSLHCFFKGGGLGGGSSTHYDGIKL